ncbi:MAG TPA: PIN domain-containing protein [Chloroflexia bacterium]|nr:PIN domain-containing protein [Chloroflexia bacterium]
MIFVDTGAWVAFVSPDDQYHRIANQWMRDNRQPFVTTDYVVDETLTLLKARGEPIRAQELGALLIDNNLGSFANLYYLVEDDILNAWQVFRTYSDKEWSFTDCTSKVVIEKLGITHAFAFDQHFRQFGTVAVVPSIP